MSEPRAAAVDLVLRGRVLAPGGELPDGVVAIGGERIEWVGAAADLPVHTRAQARRIGTTILPGLIDLHCHGGAGQSFPDGSVDGARAAAQHHLAHGTTGLVASLVAAAETDLLRAAAVAADLVDEGLLIGIHLEGPFLAAARCGAQDPAFLRVPDLRLLERLLAAGRGHVVSMTYAAELARADELVVQLGSRRVVPSLGHTDADAATAAQSLSLAAANGPTGLASVTHLFNGMRPFHHRDPGPVGAALRAAARGEAVLELVADGVHLSDGTAATVFELVGPGSVLLVTDAMAAAGMPDGRYRLGSQEVLVAGGVARLAASGGAPGPLAGGTTRLLDVVRRCVTAGGVPLAVAVEAASRTPARLLGLAHERGALAAGLRADVLAVDDDLTPVAVWSAGRRVDSPPALQP